MTVRERAEYADQLAEELRVVLDNPSGMTQRALARRLLDEYDNFRGRAPAEPRERP